METGTDGEGDDTDGDRGGADADKEVLCGASENIDLNSLEYTRFFLADTAESGRESGSACFVDLRKQLTRNTLDEENLQCQKVMELIELGNLERVSMRFDKK